MSFDTTPRKGSDFAGLSVAIITPFADGEVDYGRLREQLEFQLDAGTRCIVPVGTTGESPTLSHDEHERVIIEVIQCVAGRAKVMAGTGSNSTAEALRLTQRAAAEGADATLQVAPYYNKPAQEGFYQHFKAVAEAVDIPVCVYNIPGRCGKEIEVETIQRLAEVPGITMVKEATGKLDQCSAIVGSTDLTVLCGDDSLTLPMMSVGAEGVISVVGNLVPSDMIALVEAASEGDLARAGRLHHQLFALCQNMLGLATNPIPVKAAMRLVGRDTGELRLPMTSLEEAAVAKLQQTLFAYGIASASGVSA
ncbi:4-hydroxy-tetrahydrodipicolinate synthase [Novipirellula artificiosorum]|uniref:4-hydroxy-tetrahydrodipicolinate synthase n=1 Tax=Novipirellula artificiosorum TaxID=2528016 RepID=A0A5C6D3W5_9BACT|nr:4-hydroxy-tetrahydrodipicolinate synthase [Novipirellula artificiosorum]TWU31582.1 4-hydroxy-tetrahydrodipicolinate synthase [Novipirellula artificiosorum]